jgi:hypothetical protein
MRKIHLCIEHPVASDTEQSSVLFSTVPCPSHGMAWSQRDAEQLDDPTLCAMATMLRRDGGVKITAKTRAQRERLSAQLLAKLDSLYPRRNRF